MAAWRGFKHRFAHLPTLLVWPLSTESAEMKRFPMTDTKAPAGKCSHLSLPPLFICFCLCNLSPTTQASTHYKQSCSLNSHPLRVQPFLSIWSMIFIINHRPLTLQRISCSIISTIVSRKCHPKTHGGKIMNITLQTFKALTLNTSFSYKEV